MNSRDINRPRELCLPASASASASATVYAGSARVRVSSRAYVGVWLALAGLTIAPGAACTAFTISTSAEERTSDDWQDAQEPASPSAPADSAARALALDQRYGYKGWDIPFPSFSDSLSQDKGEWRTELASNGFGFSAQSIPIFQSNVLDTPRRVPSNTPTCVSTNLDYNCAGGRSYFGQKPDIFVSNLAYLTYDMSRHGVQDGQLALGVHWGLTTDESYSPKTVRVFLLSWYLTLLDGRVEVKAGYFPSLTEFMGTFVGGMVTNPFGPNGFLPLVMGMSPNNVSTPNFRATWHINDSLYAQTGIQRSLPVRGPTGNPIYDEVQSNSSGLKFESPIPGTRLLYTNELGYRRQASPQSPYLWFRGGVLYNTSDFTDYSRVLEDPGATKRDVLGFYALGDYQVLQQAPASPYTAYRGLYVGASVMSGREEIAAFPRYYEARAYWLGPFGRRPQDMISVIYSHNVVSKDIRAVTSAYSSYTNLFSNTYANSLTASYMFHVTPGLYATLGLGYTDNPSLQYFEGEGSSLNVLASMYVNF